MSSRAEGGGRARRVLAACGVTHFAHDGFSDTLYVLLPLWADAFGLSHAQVGLLKSVFSTGAASFQLPAGLLAERWGERVVLAAGTLAAGLAYVLFGLAGGFAALAGLALLAGLASGTQHPLSSVLVARAYRDGPRRAALGAYNFTGDLGKIALPALVAGGAALVGWRTSSLALGVFGCGAALGMFLVLRRLAAGGATPGVRGGPWPRLRGGWGITDRSGFRTLAAIGVLDSAVRAGFLTFLPFLLIAKGAPVATVGLALALVFAGGAAGKLACGLLAERIGIIRTVVATELATGAGILSLLAVPLEGALVLLPLVGLALNGTSSVLYGTVPEFVAAETQSRAFGLFYTLSSAAGALAPILCGVLSDSAGVPVALATLALAAFVPIPLCRSLAPSLKAGR